MATYIHPINHPGLESLDPHVCINDETKSDSRCIDFSCLSSNAVDEQISPENAQKAIASRLEAIASRLEAIASRLEAMACRLEAIASRLEAIIAL